MVGAGRFELPTPCAQGIESLPPRKARTRLKVNEMARDRLQPRNPLVVDSVAGKFLSSQHPATSTLGAVKFGLQWGMPLQVDAVYENGVLRPLQPLDLREHEHVVVSVVKANAPARSSLDVDYIEKMKRELQDADPAPGLDEVRRRLSKISGSMAAEMVADRGER